MRNDQVPDLHRAAICIYDEIMYTHEISHTHSIEMAVCVTIALRIICKLMYPDGLVRDCRISCALATGMLWFCTGPSIQCMGNNLVPDWYQANVYIYNDIMYIHEISHIYYMEMTVCVTYVWHMSVICKLIYLDGLMRDCNISSALAFEMLQTCTRLLV